MKEGTPTAIRSLISPVTTSSDVDSVSEARSRCNKYALPAFASLISIRPSVPRNPPISSIPPLDQHLPPPPPPAVSIPLNLDFRTVAFPAVSKPHPSPHHGSSSDPPATSNKTFQIITPTPLHFTVLKIRNANCQASGHFNPFASVKTRLGSVLLVEVHHC